MVDVLNHQKRIGVVGTGPEAENFLLKANQLGFHTHQLRQEVKESEMLGYADKIFTGDLDDPLIQEKFIMQNDLLVYFDCSITSEQLEEAKKSIVIPQEEDLLAIARDRVLQKAFKESLSVNIAPFETIVKEEDIINALPSIGYPAVLRTNFTQPGEPREEYFIYDKSDVEEASILLKYGTCVLESWITSEYQLSKTLVKSTAGTTQLYPTIQRTYRNGRLASVEKFVSEDTELNKEIERVTQLIAENISFVGAVTVDFVISPAQALYIGDIHAYPNSLTRYSEGNSVPSIVEAHLRAVTSLPLVEVDDGKKDFLYLPLYEDQRELIDESIAKNADWKFHFYPQVKEEQVDQNQEIGYVLIETENIKRISEVRKEYTD